MQKATCETKKKSVSVLIGIWISGETWSHMTNPGQDWYLQLGRLKSMWPILARIGIWI